MNKIIILIYVHNRPNKLHHVIEKYLRQFDGHPNLEFVITDFGGGKRTANMIEGYAKKYPNTFYHYLETNPNFPPQTIRHRPIKM